jgi:hypothetical protein
MKNGYRVPRRREQHRRPLAFIPGGD